MRILLPHPVIHPHIQDDKHCKDNHYHRVQCDHDGYGAAQRQNPAKQIGSQKNRPCKAVIPRHTFQSLLLQIHICGVLHIPEIPLHDLPGIVQRELSVHLIPASLRVVLGQRLQKACCQQNPQKQRSTARRPGDHPFLKQGFDYVSGKDNPADKNYRLKDLPQQHEQCI